MKQKSESTNDRVIDWLIALPIIVLNVINSARFTQLCSSIVCYALMQFDTKNEMNAFKQTMGKTKQNRHN